MCGAPRTFEYRPLAHFRHWLSSEAPSSAPYRPTGQFSQLYKERAARYLLYLPCGQERQCLIERPPLLRSVSLPYFPTLQSWHEFEPIVLMYWPTTHTLQVSCPVSSWYCPATQRSQAWRWLALCDIDHVADCPTGHALQSFGFVPVLVSSKYLPFGHKTHMEEEESKNVHI